MENKLVKGIVFSPKFWILIDILTFNIKSQCLRLDLIAKYFVLFCLTPNTCVQLIKQQEVRLTAQSVPHAVKHKPSIGVPTVPHFTDYISLEKSLMNLFPAICFGDIHSGPEFMCWGIEKPQEPGEDAGEEMIFRAPTLMRKDSQTWGGCWCCGSIGT